MKHWQFLPVLVLVTIFTGCRDKKLESAQAKTTRPDSMESRNGTKEEQTGGAHRGGASASRPGKESHPVDLAAGDQHLRELIRKTEDAEKNDTYDSSDGKKKMDAGFAVSLDERVLAEMKAVLPDEPPLEVFGVTGAIAPAFIKRMTLYPHVDALEVHATPNTFLVALQNLRAGGTIETPSSQLARFCVLTGRTPDRSSLRVALGTLMSAAGSYTDSNDRFHRNAYNTVLKLMTPETVTQTKPYFDSPEEACFVMLYAGGRFIRNGGELDEAAYQAALERLTPTRIEAVKKMMQKPTGQRACDALLRPYTSVNNGRN